MLNAAQCTTHLTLGIIAGGGDAPKRLMAACRRMKRPFVVLALEGQTDKDIADIGHEGEVITHTWVPLGAAQAALDYARAHHVQDIVMIGRVRRPSLSELKPDALMMKKLTRIGLSLFGDDGLLKAIAKEMESEGFRIIAAQDIFADFLMPDGVLGDHAPDELALSDIARGVHVVSELGRLDIGQAVIVQQGIILGLEAVEGTDALIRRAGLLRRDGPGGVLVKLIKPQQDRRFDLPSLGVETVREAIAAGLRGIVGQSNATLFLDRDATIAAANAGELFIMGVTPNPIIEQGKRKK
jgi:DUF1009 family protein